MGDLNAVYAAVDRAQGRFVADLQRVVQQPSISSQGVGVRECAELLVEMMGDLGIAARVMDTAGLPVVYGEISAPDPAAPTLVIYNHYDVQPPEPLEEWTHPPFGAEVVDGVLYGRGATDAKGNLLAHLKAVDAFRSAGVPLPCNLKFLFDGEEESGSPSLPAFVAAHTDLLAADAALSFDGGFDADNRPHIGFGESGLLFVEIRVRGAGADLHSARARLVQNPAWRLVWALSALKGPDGRINLEDFYAPIRPVTASDRAALAQTGWDDETQRRSLGTDRFLGDVSGLAAFEQLLFTPTCNIAGFGTGWMGEGHKTVLPSRASCRLDFRLVADQDPDTILASLRRFLDEHDCADFEIEDMGSIEPSRTVLDTPFARVVIDAARQVYGGEPAVRPTGDASGRQGVWLGGQLGGIPAAGTGIGPPAWRGHAANEFMTIGHYLNGIKYAATIWDFFGTRR
ncbi:MAG TPA: M20/M25/M40 family metallo-hydrolase [Thermomicrobiales bacterium]|jgi:acetylornithine deacetylase/succinyl-diaminopimelate desuccinylase-like protein